MRFPSSMLEVLPRKPILSVLRGFAFQCWPETSHDFEQPHIPSWPLLVMQVLRCPSVQNEAVLLVFAGELENGFGGFFRLGVPVAGCPHVSNSVAQSLFNATRTAASSCLGVAKNGNIPPRTTWTDGRSLAEIFV